MQRRNKYFAKKSHCNKGHTHASGKEARRCNDLHSLQDQGLISGLEVEPQFWFVIKGEQVKHQNGRRVGYRPDFGYYDGVQYVVEDVKSKFTMTEAAVLRMAIFRALFPSYELRVVL